MAAGHLVFELSRDLPRLDAELRAVRKQSMAPPDVLRCYDERGGGKHLSVDSQILVQLLDEQRRARFREELRHASPTVIRRLYAAAAPMETDEDASLVRYIESQHGDGWSGPAHESDDMLDEAQALRRLIEEARTSRIPAELNEAAAVVESVSRLVAKASHEKTHKVTPINLAQWPDLAQHWEAIREELETAARTEGQHREAAAS